MNREEALALVKPHLTDHRYTHTVGVTDTAIKLANRYGANSEQAELAGIFHDYAKFRNKEEMRTLVKEKLTNDINILEYGSELLHAPCGAYYVKHEIGIKDEEILNAIRYHTTGREGMTLLEKVIFLADYIEPGRDFKGVDEVRELADIDLDKAIIQMLVNTISFLMKRQQRVFPTTIETYNDFVKKQKKKEK